MAYNPRDPGPFPKSRGDAIRSQDWNEAVNEVLRLNDHKVNKAGDAITGSLNVSGNVGVGTTSPGAKLHVAGGSIRWGNNSELVADQGGSIELGGNNATAGTGLPYIDFHFSGLTQDFNTRITNDANGRLSLMASTLQATGNVGIGTASPQRALSVNAALNVDQANANTGAVNPGITFGSSSGEGIASKRTAGGNQAGLDLYTNNAARLSITNNGNVGIGTANPQFGRLMIEDGAVPLSLRETGQAGTQGGLWRMPLDAGILRFDVNTAAAGDFSSYVTPVAMNAVGNVGIGTTAPGAKLDISGSGGAAQCCAPAAHPPTLSLAEASSSANRQAWLQFHNVNEAECYIRLAGGGPTGSGREGQRRLEIGDSQGVMTGLTVTGNVGIGTTAPENAEGWNKVLDILGGAHTKLSIRTASIDARVMAHAAWWGAPAGMLIGTHTNHSLSFGTNRSTRMIVDANGNVGIGTTGPLFKLHVVGPGGFGGEDSTGVSQAGNVPLVAQSNGTAIGIINSNGRQAFALNIDGNAGTNNARGVPTFYDKYDGGWHQCLSLKNGNVGIGTTGPEAKLHVVGGDIRLEATRTFYSPGRMHIHGEEILFLLNLQGVNISKAWGGNGNLIVEGQAWKPGGGGFAQISDKRLKKGVKPLKGALDKLTQLRGVSFEWRKPEEQGDLTGPQIGMVAQEVEEVLPEWVEEDPRGYKGLAIRGFEALAVEAFKELKAENETLKTKNEELEERIRVLEVNAAGRADDRGVEDTGEVDATEAAERKARELGVQLSEVKGTGSGGRVVVRDVEKAAKG